MKTIIEVTIGDGEKRPSVRKCGNKWVIVGECNQCVAYGRAVWVKTFRSSSEKPDDGKGLLVGPTGKLSIG